MKEYRTNAIVVTEARTRWWFWDHLFANFRWYRRRCGGHWERWWIDICHTHIWFQKPCDGKRPPCAYGSPECEDYTAAAAP